jgi:hypothetical protein
MFPSHVAKKSRVASQRVGAFAFLLSSLRRNQTIASSCFSRISSSLFFYGENLFFFRSLRALVDLVSPRQHNEASIHSWV